MGTLAAYLPNETIRNIARYASIRAPSPVMAEDRVETLDLKPLHHMCLVNRIWKDGTLSTLYSQWTYDDRRRDTKDQNQDDKNGDDREHSLVHVWRFIRTVLRNPSIASYVQLVDIRFHRPDFTRPKQVNLSVEDQTCIRNALALAGLKGFESVMLKAFVESNCKPLIALLVTVLPKLRMMNVVMGGIDPCLSKVLDLAVRSGSNHPVRRAFQHLEEANLRTPESYEGEDSSFCAKNGHFVFYLPHITRLSMFDFMPQEPSPSFLERTRKSAVTDLVIAPLGNWTLTLGTAQMILGFPMALVRLSLYFNDDTGSRQRRHAISNAEIGKLLSKHSQSLQYLDIYRDCEGHDRPRHRSNNSFMELLNGFIKLRTLLVQPEVLLGGCCGGKKAPFDLTHTLPEGLESLTFYGNEGLATNKELDQQLVNLVYNPAFTSLKSILVADMRRVLKYFADPVKLPRWTVEQACNASGVIFRIVDQDILPKGGSLLQLSRDDAAASDIIWHSRLRGLGTEPLISTSDHDHQYAREPIGTDWDNGNDGSDEDEDGSGSEDEEDGSSVGGELDDDDDGEVEGMDEDDTTEGEVEERLEAENSDEMDTGDDVEGTVAQNVN